MAPRVLFCNERYAFQSTPTGGEGWWVVRALVGAGARCQPQALTSVHVHHARSGGHYQKVEDVDRHLQDAHHHCVAHCTPISSPLPSPCQGRDLPRRRCHCQRWWAPRARACPRSAPSCRPPAGPCSCGDGEFLKRSGRRRQQQQRQVLFFSFSHAHVKRADVGGEDCELADRGLEQRVVQRRGGAKPRVQPAKGMVKRRTVQGCPDQPKPRGLAQVEPGKGGVGGARGSVDAASAAAGRGARERRRCVGGGRATSPPAHFSGCRACCCRSSWHAASPEAMSVALVAAARMTGLFQKRIVISPASTTPGGARWVCTV